MDGFFDTCSLLDLYRRVSAPPHLFFNFPKVEAFSGLKACVVLVFGGGGGSDGPSLPPAPPSKK